MPGVATVERGMDMVLSLAGFSAALALILSQTYPPLRVHLTPLETYAAPVLGAFVLALSLRALLNPKQVPHLQAIGLFGAGEIFVLLGFCAKLAAGGDNAQLAATYMMWIPALVSFGCLVVPHAIVLWITWCQLAVMALATTIWLGFGQEAGGASPVVLQTLMTGFLSLFAMAIGLREISIRAGLATASLESAKTAAERASLARTQFLARMSHDLRPRLKVIIDFAEAIRSEVLGGYEAWSHYRTYAREILHSGEALLAMINDLRDIARIEAGALPLKFTSVDTGAVVEESLASLEEAAARGGVALVNETPQDATLPVIRADLHAVRKIVDTLLSNAVRFTPAGQSAGVRLTRAGGGLSLTVWDNGVGMDAADLSRLGEPFQRTGPSPVSEAPGLGISLAITRHLVALHGGTLEFQSTVGIGTTVRVTLPVAQPGVDPNLS